MAVALLCALLPALVAVGSTLETMPSRPGYGLHRHMAKEHLYLFFGDPELPDRHDYPYHTTTPSEVTASGGHVTFDLSDAGHRRRKRRATGTDADDDSRAYFKISAFDNDYHLSVTESEPMFGEYTVIEHRSSDGNVTHTEPLDVPSHCFYRGHVSSLNGSLVAFSTCSGMRGAVLSGKDAFYVDPLPDYLLEHPENVHGHTHLVYRRSTDFGEAHVHPPSCGASQTAGQSRYRAGDNDGIEFDGAVDEVRAKFNPQRKAVHAQFGNMHIEMAIVVDPDVYTSHNQGPGNKALTMYIYTLMNVMESVLKPSGTGFHLSLHLTRIIILTAYPTRFPIGHNSETLLRDFCKFQKSVNPDYDEHPLHHDYAMLLTGTDLCPSSSTRGCGELGRAFIGSLCYGSTSCGVVRDGGIQNGVIMAHEFGHVLGAYHDTTICRQGTGYAMEASISDASRYWEFSDCSRANFRHLLGSSQSSCVLDCPRQAHGLVLGNDVKSIVDNVMTTTIKLPGERYSIDEQCHFRFPNHTDCYEHNQDICKKLYCRLGNSFKCWTNNLGALEGTKCAVGRVCRRGSCVDRRDLKWTVPTYTPCQRGVMHPIVQSFSAQAVRVDGSWGTWTAWSKCDMTCGEAFKYRQRKCDSPEPSAGGADCIGAKIDVEPCGTPPCRATSAASRPFKNAEEVCTALSTKATGPLIPYRTTKDFTASHACKVLCYSINDDSRQPKDFNISLPNGAACSVSVSGLLLSGMCVDGVCMQDFGCDGSLKSGVKRDECGTCGGTGQCCTVTRRVKGSRTTTRAGFNSAIVLPRGADNVIARLGAPSPDFVLSLFHGYKAVFNGDKQSIVTRARKMVSSSIPSLVQYNHPASGLDVLTIRGKLARSLELVTYRHEKVGNLVDPGIDVTYTVDKTRVCSEEFYWRIVRTPCTGCPGKRTTHTVCMRRSNAQAVHSSNCRSLSGSVRNSTETCMSPDNCDTDEYQWRYYSWSQCSRSCGGGRQKRTVKCFSVNRFEVVDNSLCTVAKPDERQSCNERMCGDEPYFYVNKKWSPCSATCGEGVQVRVVQCRVRVKGKKFNMPPFVCENEGVPKIESIRKCKAGRECRADPRKPAGCKDISPLCVPVRNGRGCSMPGMRDMCCNSCFS